MIELQNLVIVYMGKSYFARKYNGSYAYSSSVDSAEFLCQHQHEKSDTNILERKIVNILCVRCQNVNIEICLWLVRITVLDRMEFA